MREYDGASPEGGDGPSTRLGFKALLDAWLSSDVRPGAGWRGYAGTVAIVGACTTIAALMQRHFELSNLTMVFLLGVVVSAIAFGRGPAITAAVLSVAVFDFGFVPPRATLSVADTQYLVTFGVMLVVAVVIGTLTAWLREQLELARQRERHTAALYRLSHDLALRSDPTEILDAAVERITDTVGTRVAALLPGVTGALEVRAGASELVRDAGAVRDAQRAYDDAQPVGAGREGRSDGALFFPMQVGPKVLGVLAAPAGPPTYGRLELLRALGSQTALALERCRLADDARVARTQAETERTRSALLSSVSHDLRTPLAAITGAASNLRDDAALPAATRKELIETISDEALRLNRLIASLLDMTRLEAGALRVHKDWYALEEVVGAALARLEPQLRQRPIHLVLAPSLPLIPLDDVLFEQVIWNLLDNANKYSGPDRPVEISALVEGGGLRLEIADRGPGLARGEESRVFEKFFRGSNIAVHQGVGLGLAICQGIVHAHGGTIAAANRLGGGAVFTVWLPLEGEPPAVEDESLDDVTSAGEA